MEELYFRKIAGNAAVHDRHLVLEPGSHITLDTYLNNFYQDYWARATVIDDVAVEVDFSGSISIGLFGAEENGIQRLSHHHAECETKSTIHIPVEGPVSGKAPRRLFLDIASPCGAILHGVRFTTRTPPPRPVKLTIGLCTFNREEFLLRTLAGLLDIWLDHPGLLKIIVVNQGDHFSNPDLASLANNSDHVALITQANLGGSGGFTRTMVEALQLDGVTHHLLMDDDIILDARTVPALARVLQYAHDDVAIGGAMLDLEQPHVLYEAGGKANADTTYDSLHHIIDLKVPASLSLMTEAQEADYNAWWCCAFPMSAIRKAGLPLPFFIHVDDVEYGVRLRGCGVPTIPFPGIAVWHAPFYAKNSEWQRYYGIRNRLIMASAHPARFQLISATVGLLWWMLEAAAVHNYLRAALIGKAVQDFLRGPRLFMRSASDIHHDVMEIAQGLASPTVAAREAPSLIQQARAMPGKDLTIAVLLVSRILGFLCLPQRRPAVLLLESQVDVANVAFGSYVKTDAQGRYFLLYRLNRSKLLGALLSSIRIWAIYVATRSRVAKSWNAEIPRLRGQPFWSRAFTGVPDRE